MIVDEFHELDSDRGPVIEMLIVMLKTLNPKLQIIALSATISNAKEMITDLEIEYRNCLSKLKEPPKLPEDEKSKMLSEMVGDMAKEGVNEDG